MDEKLDMRKQYALEAQKATCILGCTNRGVAAGIGRRLSPLCFALVRSQLEYCVQTWDFHHKKDILLLE